MYLLSNYWIDCINNGEKNLTLLAALGPGVYSTSYRNEYQKQKNNVSGKDSAAGT
jgi:hypothetical protein